MMFTIKEAKRNRESHIRHRLHYSSPHFYNEERVAYHTKAIKDYTDYIDRLVRKEDGG